MQSMGEQETWATLKKLHREMSAAQHMNNLKNEMQEGGKAGDDYSVRQPASVASMQSVSSM